MENQKTQMAKRQFRIGDLAKELKVKKFVIRFWEKEFNLKSDRSQGGQRFYTHEDLNIFLTIKDLLYNQGFTIAGAKKQLPEVLAGAKLAPDDSFQELTMEQSMSMTEESDDLDQLDNEQDHQEKDDDEELDLQHDAHKAACDELNVREIVQKIVCAPQESLESLLCNEEKIEVTVQVSSDQDVQACQSAQETCVPARAVPDSSFYEGLTTLKDQLMRLYELLD